MRRTFHRVYTFRDIVGLRIIALLRNHHRVPLQDLRRIGAWLRHHYETPWSSLKLWLAGRRVVFSDSASDDCADLLQSGQEVMSFNLQAIADDMSAAADSLKQRQPDQIGKVVRHRHVVHNAWVVAGTRVPTEAIWNFHRAGFSTDAIVREYPRLTRDDIKAALEFATGRQRKLTKVDGNPALRRCC